MRSRAEVSTASSDGGAVLILAMVFLLAIGLITVATAAMAVNANVNTSNAHQQLVTQANLESEVSLAMQAARNSYDYAGCTSVPAPAADNCYAASGFSSSANCTPSAASIGGLSVWCDGSGASANGIPTRTVDFFVCRSGVSPCAGSPSVALFAEVVYTDLPAGEPQSADQCTRPPTPSTATCGLTMSVTSWDVSLADS